MKKVLCFGELLLRICPDMDAAWLESNSLPFYVGGAELNVATALAKWQKPVAYLTALPDNFMSSQLIDYMHLKGIDTSLVQKSGDRVGLYYLPKGKDLKNAGVIYDRAHSSFSALKPKELDWERIFEGIGVFHFSAICPALNADIAAVCQEAVNYASKNGVFISLDFNYREKLWKYGKQPHEVMPILAEKVNLIMGNVWSTSKMLGYPVPEDLPGDINQADAAKQVQLMNDKIFDSYPNCQLIANTFRFDVDEGLRYFALLSSRKEQVQSKVYFTDSLVDQVGSGDCFMAGLLNGYLESFTLQDTLDFATAAAFSKLFIHSDATNMEASAILKSVVNYEQN